jgi:hypothetical protein
VLAHLTDAAERFHRRALSSGSGDDDGPSGPHPMVDADGEFTVPSTISGYSSTAAAVPLVAHRVALPDIAGEVGLLASLPRETANYYAAPRACIRASSAPPAGAAAAPSASGGVMGVAAASAATASPPRARVFGSHAEYVKVLARMHARGMLTYTTRPKVVVGLFCVDKPDGMLRKCLDTSKLRALGFAPQVSLADGIGQTILEYETIKRTGAIPS